MGAVIFGAMLLYLLIAIVVVKIAISYARKNNKNTRGWGLSAALIMYLIPFWDWAPTIVTYKYYCSTKSGFTVFKTLEEWMEENPGTAASLMKGSLSIQRSGGDENHIDTQVLNQRFQWISQKKQIFPLLPIYRLDDEVRDSKNGEILVRNIDYSTGVGSGYLKFWLNNRGCGNGDTDRRKLYLFVEKIINIAGSKGE